MAHVRQIVLTLASLVTCYDVPGMQGDDEQSVTGSAAHGSAVEGFSFEPPLSAALDCDGPFDFSAAPSVEVDELGADGGVARVLVSWNTSPTPGTDTVRVEPHVPRYAVTWDTHQLVPRLLNVYRIRVVLPGGRELGFVDVRPIAGDGLRNLQTGERLHGDVLPIRFRVERAAEAHERSTLPCARGLRYQRAQP